MSDGEVMRNGQRFHVGEDSVWWLLYGQRATDGTPIHVTVTVRFLLDGGSLKAEPFQAPGKEFEMSIPVIGHWFSEALKAWLQWMEETEEDEKRRLHIQKLADLKEERINHEHDEWKAHRKGEDR